MHATLVISSSSSSFFLLDNPPYVQRDTGREPDFKNQIAIPRFCAAHCQLDQKLQWFYFVLLKALKITQQPRKEWPKNQIRDVWTSLNKIVLKAQKGTKHVG